MTNSMNMNSAEGKGERRRRIVRGGLVCPDGALFRAALDQSGRTREQLAVRCGISSATIARILSGKTVSRQTSQLVARALGLRLERIEAKTAAAVGVA